MCVRIGSAAIAASALLLGAALSRAQAPTMRTAPRDLVGCYVFGLGDWMLLDHRWVRDSVAPAVVTLDTTPSESGWWRLIAEFTQSTADHSSHTARWRIRGDTLDLSWSRGIRPTRAILWRLGPGALTGYAIAERDTANRRRASARAEARRIACEGERPSPRATPDAARLVGDRLIIEPLGISFRVPQLWLGTPRRPRQRFGRCADRPDGALAERILTDRRLLPMVTYARHEWKTEFSTVVDSVAPFDALVAQAGGGRWNLDGHCVTTVQLRIYVGRFSPEWLISRVETVGVRAARRFFEPVTRTVIDTASWRSARLSWSAFYYDYGGTAYVEFLTRTVRGHTVALVFMYVGASQDQMAERAVVLHSFEVEP